MLPEEWSGLRSCEKFQVPEAQPRVGGVFDKFPLDNSSYRVVPRAYRGSYRARDKNMAPFMCTTREGAL